MKAARTLTSENGEKLESLTRQERAADQWENKDKQNCIPKYSKGITAMSLCHWKLKSDYHIQCLIRRKDFHEKV